MSIDEITLDAVIKNHETFTRTFKVITLTRVPPDLMQGRCNKIISQGRNQADLNVILKQIAACYLHVRTARHDFKVGS